MTQSQEAACSRAALTQYRRTLIKAGHSWISPDVYLLDTPFGAWVLKDYGSRKALFRNTWGRFMVRREVAAYRKLEGLEGIPRLVGQVDPYALVMEYVEAEELPPHAERRRLGLEFFDRLVELMEAMHRRGVTHGDVRRKNILLGQERKPYLIDFQSSLHDGPGWLRHRIFCHMARVDSLTLLKIKSRYFPKKTTREELEQLESIPWTLRLGRFVRKRLYHPLSPKVLGPRLRALFGRGPRAGQ
jgi:predicted Ser/Thr protein kinase